MVYFLYFKKKIQIHCWNAKFNTFMHHRLKAITGSVESAELSWSSVADLQSADLGLLKCLIINADHVVVTRLAWLICLLRNKNADLSPTDLYIHVLLKKCMADQPTDLLKKNDLNLADSQPTVGWSLKWLISLLRWSVSEPSGWSAKWSAEKNDVNLADLQLAYHSNGRNGWSAY